MGMLDLSNMQCAIPENVERSRGTEILKEKYQMYNKYTYTIALETHVLIYKGNILDKDCLILVQ